MNKFLISWVIISMALVSYGQNAATLIQEGRGLLQQQKLILAQEKFLSAVSASPTNEIAIFFAGTTRLLNLVQEEPVKNFLTRLGIEETNRNIYHWKAGLRSDTNGLYVINENVNLSEVLLVLRTNVLPNLVSIEQNFGAILNTNFLVNLSSNETTLSSVTIDYGDVQITRSFLKFLRFFIHVIETANANVLLGSLRELINGGYEFDFSQFWSTNEHLLTFSSTNELSLAKIALTSAIQNYIQGRSFILKRDPAQTFFFNLDSESRKHEEDFKSTLEDILNSYTGTVSLRVNTNLAIYAEAVFTGNNTWRSFLPDFRGSSLVLGSIPDTTFGGFIHGITEEDVEGLLVQLPFGKEAIPHLGSPGILPSGRFRLPMHLVPQRGYVLQFSTNLVQWQNHAAFVAKSLTMALDGDNTYVGNKFFRLIDATRNMPPPPNDSFENRLSIGPTVRKISGYNLGVVNKTNAPWSGYARKVIWYSWLPPRPGQVEISAFSGGKYPAGIAILSVGSGGGFVSEQSSKGNIRFNAEPNKEYYFGIDSLTPGQAGLIEIEIGYPPQVDLSFAGTNLNYLSIQEGKNVTLNVRVFPGDFPMKNSKLKLFSGNSLTKEIEFQGSSLTFPWTNISVGNHSISAVVEDIGGFFNNTNLALRSYPTNDMFTNAKSIAGNLPITVAGSFVAIAAEIDENYEVGGRSPSIWYEWVAPNQGFVTIKFNPETPGEIGVFTGSFLTNLLRIAGNGSQVSFQAQANQKYKIGVFGYEYSSASTFGLSLLPTRPPEVQFTQIPERLVVYSNNTNFLLKTVVSDPDGSADIQKVSFYVNGQKIGDDLTAPYEIVFTNATLGQFYRLEAIVFDKWNVSASTEHRLEIAPPPPSNDLFAAPKAIIGNLPITIQGSFRGATKEMEETYNINPNYDSSVWYEWVAPNQGFVTIKFSPETPGQIGVFTGSSLTNLLRIAGNGSQVSFQAQANLKYKIGVFGYEFSSVPTFGLSLLPTRPPQIQFDQIPDRLVIYSNSTNLLLKTIVSDPDGNAEIQRVSFYVNGEKIGEDLTPPYEMVLTNATLDSYYELEAIVFDKWDVSARTSHGLEIVPPPPAKIQ